MEEEEDTDDEQQKKKKKKKKKTLVKKDDRPNRAKTVIFCKVQLISWIQITPMKISDQFKLAATYILHPIHSTNQHSSL
jgi:hypothetical protein